MNWVKDSLEVKKFMGIALGGGKNQRTAVALIEYYPKQKKIFLSQLFDKIPTDDNQSQDAILHQLISRSSENLKTIAFDAPLSLPKCVGCKLKCPGSETCTVEEIQWLRKAYAKKNEKAKPKKHFTPYTERCVEAYVSSEFEENFHMPHALGANQAPLTARALFISRRFKIQSIEVFPRLSLWRIGQSLKIRTSYLRSHKHALEGSDIRKSILDTMVKKDIAFLYNQDVKTMVQKAQAFDAFLCALTAVLKFNKQVEKKPKGYPKGAGWIETPVKGITWA